MTDMQHELRQIAHRQRRRGAAGETLSTTALVHEAYLKFAGSPELFEQIDRAHFLSLAARAMRHIVINHARDRVAQKRGSGAHHETLGDGSQIGGDLGEATRILELNDALDQLERVRPRLAQVVQLRYFAGLSEAETGEVLDLDSSTVRRDWLKARGWLYDKLHPDSA
jgi:RNA polymerase sigma factor (TIGR02999 family)